MNKYYIVQILEKDKEEVKSIIEQRFDDLEDALHCVSILDKCVDTDKCIVEIVKWENDTEVDVVFAI
jgi:hypothetical protein